MIENIHGDFGDTHGSSILEGIYCDALENAGIGFGYYKIISDKKNSEPDYRYLEVNNAFEELTGLRSAEIINKNASEVLGAENLSSLDWRSFIPDIMNNKKCTFQGYSPVTERFFKAEAFLVDNGCFVSVYTDISTFKHQKLKLEKSLEYERTLSECSSLLLLEEEEHYKSGDIHRILELVLKACRASRVYIFENFTDEEDSLCTRLKYEHCQNGVTSNIDDPFLKHVVYEDGFGFWRDKLSSKAVVNQTIDDLPDEIRPFFEKLHIKAMINIPLHIHGRWYGFIGYDNTETKKIWSADDVDFLVTAARIISFFFERLEYNRLIDLEIQRYDDFSENAPVGILFCDTHGKIVRCNSNVMEILGSPDKKFTQEINLLTFPLLVERGIADKVRKCLEKEQCIVHEINYISKWKKNVWLRVHYKSFLTEKKITGVQLLIDDITREKNAFFAEQEVQQKLLESKEKYELALKGSNDGIWDWDLVNNNLSVSEKFTEKLGYEEDIKFSIDFFKSLVHPDELLFVNEKISNAISGIEISHDFNCRIKKVNNQYICMHIKGESLINDKGIPTRIAGSVTDITQRIQAEQKLRENRNLLQSIIDTLPGTLNVVDRDYKILLENRFKKSAKDYDGPDDTRGMTCYKAYMDRDKPCPWCKVSRVFETGEPYDEITNRDDPREKMYDRAFHIYLSPIKNEQGNVTGVVEYGVDITRIRNAGLNAEKASQAKTEFLANMSHEIRTPLNGIIGFADLLLNTDLDPLQKEYAELVNNSARTLLDIINDILDFSKIEAGRLDLEITRVNLKKQIQQAVDIIKASVMAKGLDFRLEIAPDLPEFIFVDAIRVKQVLINLLGNAVKFTEKGGVVLAITWMELDDEKGVINFSVKDTGIGISSGDARKLFRAFSQADNSVTRKFGGTGLGLIISNLLVRKMGGKIVLNSKKGRGTTFYFSIKCDYDNSHPLKADYGTLKKNSSADILTPDTLIQDHIENPKVMVAEDCLMNLFLMRMIISKFLKSPEIIEVTNGRDAVEVYMEKRPDIIFMDVNMPEMDGLEATRKIRNFEEKSGIINIPVIALTANATKKQRISCIERGMDYFLTKPVDSRKVREILDKTLGNQ